MLKINSPVYKGKTCLYTLVCFVAIPVIEISSSSLFYCLKLYNSVSPIHNNYRIFLMKIFF